MLATLFLILVNLSSFAIKDESRNCSIEHKIMQNDSVSYMLCEEKDENNNTLFYSAEIETEVCRARICEIAHITFYWDEIGDFLKFSLPKNRDLTKYDHTPFKDNDYITLQKILGDPNSLLKDLTFNEINDIIENAQKEVDAVTGATPGELANAVVKDAAFSTHTFWHIVYGAARDTIFQLLEEKTTPDFVLKKLGSDQNNVRIWAVNKAKEKYKTDERITQKILMLINDKNIDVASSALRFFSNNELEEENIQHAVINQFQQVDAIMKFEMLYRFKKLKIIYPETLDFLLNEFVEDRIGVSAYTHIMQMGEAVKEPSIQSISKINGLLFHDNFYIARKAYQFLKQRPVLDKQQEKNIQKFEKKHKERLN